MRKAIFLIFTALCAIALIACAEKPEEIIHGNWIDNDGSFTVSIKIDTKEKKYIIILLQNKKYFFIL